MQIEAYNPFVPKDRLIFVRYKKDVSRFRNKNFDLVHDFGDTELLKTSIAIYYNQRQWLINHPLLSLATEIQLVNPRCNDADMDDLLAQINDDD